MVTTQLNLLDRPVAQPAQTPLSLFRETRTIQERFETFIREHPDVFRLFRQFALQLLSAGHKHCGAKLIAERIRWEKLTSGPDAAGWKINNVFTSRLSRKLAQEDQRFKTFFRFRKLLSE